MLTPDNEFYKECLTGNINLLVVFALCKVFYQVKSLFTNICQDLTACKGLELIRSLSENFYQVHREHFNFTEWFWCNE